MGVVRVVPVGERACLVEVADAMAAASLAAWARASGLPADDVVPAATTVLFDGCDPAVVEAALPGWPGESLGDSRSTVLVAVTYDGPDLERVADHWGCSPDEVVARHTATDFTSLFCGFAPGFAYLGGLAADRAVPRLDSPRSRVEPGSVALADRWCGIYPTASPGGWLVIGRTDETLWDAGRESPALLAPGTRVRFEVPHDEHRGARARPPVDAAGPWADRAGRTWVSPGPVRSTGCCSPGPAPRRRRTRRRGRSRRHWAASSCAPGGR